MAFCNFSPLPLKQPAALVILFMKKIFPWSGLIVFSFLLFSSGSCRLKESKPALFDLVENSGVDFNNRVVDGQLENSFLFRNFYNGGGVAVGDINNDGLADIFFTSNMGDNQIYLNKGNFT